MPKRRRRSPGDGSVYYDEAAGKWFGAISLGTVNGKRVRRKVSGKTRTEVRDKLDALRREHAAGVDTVGGQQTLATFLARWLETIAETCSPKTHADYARLVQAYIVPAIGRHRLAALTPDHVQVMLRQMRESERGPRTIQKTYEILRTSLGQAVDYGYVLRNVAALVKRPSVPASKIDYLLPHEAARFLAVAAETGDRHEVLYRVALRLGLRRGELLALTWNDIDTAQRTLTIRQGKTDASARTIQVPDSLLAHLQRQRLAVMQLRLAQGAAWQEHNLVFPSEVGTPLSGRNLSARDFKRSLRNAGLRDIRFHDLRHTCATLLLSAGVPVLIVSRTLGHTSIQITLDIYGHVLPDDQREQLDRLDGLLG